MDAVKFIEERNRMCKSFDTACYDCRREFWMQEVE